MCRTQFWAAWALHLVTSCSTITESTSLGTTEWHKATPVYNALHIDFRKTFIVRIICDTSQNTKLANMFLQLWECDEISMGTQF